MVVCSFFIKILTLKHEDKYFGVTLERKLIIMKNIIILFLFLFIGLNCFSQTSDGTVRSLVNTEEYFNFLVKNEGINKGFQKFLAKKSIVFRPTPIEAGKFYDKKEAADGSLIWKPEYAMIAKNGDFGFTTGPYTYIKKGESSYGHYLSIWRSDDKNKWKLVLDGGISHPKPTQDLKYEYLDPKDRKFTHLLGPKKIQLREDIVFNTDLLLGKALYNSGIDNFNEFYDSQVRLYYPGYLPIIGKEKALDFLKNHHLDIETEPTFTDRAFSGDLAYTYGKASISGKAYSYVRIWKISETMKWNVILDVYIPAS
jgi:ketosteroid isomerase-like protein